ncbi:hypothetical protein [Sphaerisporangium sp. TRM90804]|uniref:hypothetical protein n=1 Tax=Sphaerisporangium sp. TRM90804 TaxID=3031113 RepID=UPI00244B590F|nr:hypothetical protein [Sphaerisporangium sp. TRM90804]MDH2424824.1 hypothetical protein [Sphaerisporangium sp. TRM90804]
MTLLTAGLFVAGLVVGLVLMWLLRRSDVKRITDITARLTLALGTNLRLGNRVDELESRVSDLETENTSLRDRNTMLSGLVGADAERAALEGSCADEAEWL